jgi:transposase
VERVTRAGWPHRAGQPAARATLIDCRGAGDALVHRRGELERGRRCGARLRLGRGGRAAALLRGIDTLSAVGLCAEVGDFERFARAGQLMSYLGLVPSENSSGQSRRQGAITKTGSRHARRLLVEAAWQYRKTPARGQALKRRQDGQPVQIVQTAWQAQQRLHRVWRRLDTERAKRRTIVAVAVARELAGFCWAIARAD